MKWFSFEERELKRDALREREREREREKRIKREREKFKYKRATSTKKHKLGSHLVLYGTSLLSRDTKKN